MILGIARYKEPLFVKYGLKVERDGYLT